MCVSPGDALCCVSLQASGQRAAAVRLLNVCRAQDCCHFIVTLSCTAAEANDSPVGE